MGTWNEQLRRKQGVSSFYVQKQAALFAELHSQDAWGHPLVYLLEPGDPETIRNFAIVSPGRDGVLDFSEDEIEKYFTAERENMTGQWDRDLIARETGTVLYALK